MERIIVTIKRAGEARVRDIEITADIAAYQLASMLAEALGWHCDQAGQPCTYTIEAHPPGRMLHPDETLAQAQVWDGTWLVFHRCTAPSATTMQPANHSASTPGARQQPPAAAANPVVGWTSLESPKQPPAASPPDDAPKPADGFVWKPLDKDDT